MSRIIDVFSRCKAEGRAAFIPFIMGGDPTASACAQLLDALPEAGADIIELGIPFSDPMADGPVIQAAGLRALTGGMTLTGILTLARNFRSKHATPLVLMGYLNPIFVYGYARFARDAAAAGVDGIILVDLPPEEAAELEPILSNHGIALVRLVAPTSIAGRVELLAHQASGYLYYVAVTGITGGKSADAEQSAHNIAEIRKATNLPVCVGFGIKTPADVAQNAKLADGVVVGSAIVKHIHETQGDVASFSTFVRALADGCKTA